MLIEPLHPEDDPIVAVALAALQRVSYAIEERLIGHRIPITAQTPAELVAAGLCWWGAVSGLGSGPYEGDGPSLTAEPHGPMLLGALAASVTPELVDVERLVVAPAAFRRGVGTALVGHVLALAAGRRVVVATGRDNAPARRLYERAGFTVVEDAEVAPGLWVTRYTRP